jgi:hypothetical protein
MKRLRGRHFLSDPLDRTGPQPEHLGDPQYADALLKLFSSLAFQGYVDLGPSKPRALSTARLSPALIRCRIIDRSNSAKAPVI